MWSSSSIPHIQRPLSMYFFEEWLGSQLQSAAWMHQRWHPLCQRVLWATKARFSSESSKGLAKLLPFQPGRCWNMLKLSLWTGFLWFPQESGTDPWCRWIEKWGFFFKTPWKMVNHRTRIIAVVDNTVIMSILLTTVVKRARRSTHWSCHWSQVPTSSPCSSTSLSRDLKDHDCTKEETVADAAARHYAFSEQHRPSGKDDQVMK